jgi:IS1 family transposase
MKMGSFCHDKKRQVWLWRSIDRETDTVIAFWFGRREHENVDKLLGLLEPA